ncbi:uncharacterized protein LOC132910483 [Bombus pascuorum]|uniref:uncharacterized protein LOC132910483 n=1 Tax=Bombus pascuorum TaxID=65598 RepID=UPI00298DF897|nr:uncharacterized protein LOC132910483 [Bombus pascuorum]
MQRSNVEFPFSSVFATTWRLETSKMQRYIYSLEHGTMEYGTMGRTKETLSDSNKLAKEKGSKPIYLNKPQRQNRKQWCYDFIAMCRKPRSVHPKLLWKPESPHWQTTWGSWATRFEGVGEIKTGSSNSVNRTSCLVILNTMFRNDRILLARRAMNRLVRWLLALVTHRNASVSHPEPSMSLQHRHPCSSIIIKLPLAIEADGQIPPTRFPIQQTMITSLLNSYTSSTTCFENQVLSTDAII